MELQELHLSIQEHQPNGLIDKIIDQNKEKHHVRKEDDHSSGNERRLSQC